MIRVIFYGTSEFAVPSLEALTRDARFLIVAVVTQPDRPVGRHARLTPPPVKQIALAHGLGVHQFDQVKQIAAFDILSKLAADVAVVASFGQIIPQSVLDLTPHGAVNIHASLLPKYRGASPISAAIKYGDAMTGVTFMQMDALLDHGPILRQAEISIDPHDTAPSLSQRLAALGADRLPDVLIDLMAGAIQPLEQDHANASKTKILTREDGLLDPLHASASELERLVRAYEPWPGTYLNMPGRRLKILKADLGQPAGQPPGSYIIDNGYPAIVCHGGGCLRLIKIQPEGKTALDGKDFINGYPSITFITSSP